MKKVMLGIKHFMDDENGATAIEYGLIAALIAVVIIGAVTATGLTVKNAFCAVAKAINNNGAVTGCP